MSHPDSPDSPTHIHESAIVGSDVHFGRGVVVGPYVLVEDRAVVGEGSVLASHCVVRAGVVLGREVSVDSFAVIGGAPQAHDHDSGRRGRVAVGRGAVIREAVTIHASTEAHHTTTVGPRVLLMANSHVGHDCTIGADCVLANSVMLAGHVVVGERAFLGGGAGVHQHVRVGAGAMVAGNASIAYDVPPFALAGERNELFGINTVGLTRRGAKPDVIAELKSCFRAVLFGPGDPRDRALSALQARAFSADESVRFLRFFAGTRRGFCHVSRDPFETRRIHRAASGGARRSSVARRAGAS